MSEGRFKTTLIFSAIILCALIVFGLLWAFVFGPRASEVAGISWYLFSFAAGLTMIVLPCTLPLAFVIVPLSMGKGPVKGLGIALSFGAGVALMLSMYGVIAAAVGSVAIGTLNAPLETVKNWVYFFAGIFAFLFALGGIGLVKFRMPSYTGAAPAFIQKQQDFIKAFLLGVFLGNIGVGCPHPATPLILIEIASSGNTFYGWSLFLIHAIGRVLPLLLLAVLGILGVNGLSWLVTRKEQVERATGWAMVFVAGYILTLGLFTHDWWVYSGQHTLLESFTQEERFLGSFINRLGLAEAPHQHGPGQVAGKLGLFDLPLWLGNWVLVILWIVPLWWYYMRRKKDAKALPDSDRVSEEKILSWIFWCFISFSALLVAVFVYVLPDRFLFHGEALMDTSGTVRVGDDHAHGGGSVMHEENQITHGLAVNLRIDPSVPVVGAPAQFDFLVNEKPTNTPVPASSLQVEHEKLMHVIGLRADMNEFFHIHPDALASGAADTGVFRVWRTFAKPGQYKVWSEIKKDGINHSFGHQEFRVEQNSPFGKQEPEYDKQVSFTRNVLVAGYQVSLVHDPIVKGRETLLSFDIHTPTGQEASVEPYLGANMHLAVIKDDWTQFIHTHPADMMSREHAYMPLHWPIRVFKEAKADAGHDVSVPHGGDETINFRVIFPESGVYKVFGQFRPQGTDLPADEALTASFWVEVKDQPALAVSPWWILLISSLILIGLLSKAVQKYLAVSE
ncbi:MAG: hypothetical protein A3C84_05130 [Candidatus Ryanbacteria bacterium RIFCSPHIGHO2_02_FULL_48_12]|uniref:Cytochrome C biogenesis protein transmembrane domain-containing protein n=1 Tax=Candidatus Ryanbacteria bacterium RIFCSPHIGHO2_01_FULL_48_27 TaxID=1802115 RepID=A0A1G2G7B1_9BACT|nr:MAG: hypothetical protein A2756_05995 [Candidatus Ryanbacteria bacterium RIFCSPHIGHO2_01_FULL_48_27]OGZ49544.1 MAG: hypothetical protein A3C84_05130 [Candidatus Ryanbacteria bacterium RIFCSPHIGHO2_02_FULL_48_12]